MTSLLLTAVLATMTTAATAAEPCELPTDLALQAEQAVIEGRFTDMEPLVDRFEKSLSCSPPVDPQTLAAFLRAEGAWFHLTGLTKEAQFVFRSAHALAPDSWTVAFGAQMRDVFDSASQTARGGQGVIQLEPAPADTTLVTHIDGTPAKEPLQLDAGVHAIQLVRGPDSNGQVGAARFGRLVAVFPDEDIRINPGILPVEEATLLTTARKERPTWLLASAGGAAILSGVTAAIALSQPAVARNATTLSGVNQAESRQRSMAFTSYGALGVSAVATGVYLAW